VGGGLPALSATRALAFATLGLAALAGCRCGGVPIDSGLHVTVTASGPLDPIASLAVDVAESADESEFVFSHRGGAPVELPAELWVDTGDRAGIATVTVLARDDGAIAFAMGSADAQLVPGTVVELTVELTAGDGMDGGSGNCGDGLLQGMEECDDGNQAANDGCGTQCLFELRDLDGDGTCTPTSFAADPLGLCKDFLDCNDANPAVHTGAAETCTNAATDDDCDGAFEVDENGDGVEDRGVPCDTMLPGACAAGTNDCVGATLGCAGPAAGSETCNGIDDDCDGSTDEDGAALCATGEACEGVNGCTCGGGPACTAPDVCCGGACGSASACGCMACGAGETCMAGTLCACGPLVAPTGGVPVCAPGEACCGATCVPILDDPANCGACDASCGPGETCNGTQCTCGPDAALVTGVPACDLLEACCSSGCSLLDDAANCGACDQPCGNGETCAGGFCACGTMVAGAPATEACPGTPLCCAGACITCDPVFGACGPTGACDCTSGLSPCGTSCYDLQHDPTRCGSCSAPDCAAGELCDAGACTCRPFLLECPPASGTCVDPMTARTTCGSCTLNCGTGNTCFEGACAPGLCSDQPGQNTFCTINNAPNCVSDAAELTSPLHCGNCDAPCNTDEVCSSGNCESFTVGRGCTSCPCADCTGACCLYPGTTDLVICLAAGTTCP
jgi:hypothetical protein